MLTLIVLAGGIVFVALPLVWIVRTHRFRPPAVAGQPVVCLEGVGLPAAERGSGFMVAHRQGPTSSRVLVGGAVLEGWGAKGLRPGRRLTVFGVATEASCEALYRERGHESVLEAYRIVRGWRPRAWRLVTAWSLSGALIVFCMAPRPVRRLDYRQTAAQVVCPSGTKLATLHDFETRGWSHFCRATGAPVRVYYRSPKDGSLESQFVHWKAGTYDGPWVTYDPNGRLLVRGRYAGGQRDGEWTEWYTSGWRKVQGTYVAGRPHRRWTWWYPDGTKRFVVDYNNGELHGLAFEFDERHHLRWSGQYWHGKRDQTWTVRDRACLDVFAARNESRPSQGPEWEPGGCLDDVLRWPFGILTMRPHGWCRSGSARELEIGPPLKLGRIEGGVVTTYVRERNQGT